MPRFVLTLAGALGLAAGCVSAPAVHPRALECNELCARFLTEGDLNRAEVQCDLGLQFSPQYADLWVNKGLIALKRGRNEQAKEHFIKALRYNQEQAQAYNNLGFVYYQNREFGKAHDNFQRALKVNPDYTEARYNLALALKELGERPKARKEFRTIIEINHNLADPHHRLGVMAFEDQQYEEAIEWLQKAVALDPQYAEAWANLGLAFSQVSRCQEAKDAFVACLEIDSNNPQCRDGAAINERKCALLAPTLKEAKESAQTKNSPDAFFTLARAYREKGLRNEEERAYHKCVRLDGRYAPCHFGLYEVFQSERRDKEATIACRNFLKFATAEDFPKEYEQCERFIGGRSN